MENRLLFKHPAQGWNEAIPLGNGHMGMMMFGEAKRERLALSDLTFWSGQAEDNCREEAPEILEKMKKELLQNKYERAASYQDSLYGVKKNYGTNLPVGTLYAEKMEDTENIVPIDHYERTLKMDQGIANITYTADGAWEEREAFVSNTPNIGMFRWRSDAVKGVNLRIYFKDENDKDNAPSYTCRKDVNGTEFGVISFVCRAREKLHSDGTCGVDLKGTVEILVEGGRMEAEETSLCIYGAKGVICCLAMHTNFQNGLENQDKQIQQVWERGYDAIRKAHAEAFQRLFQKSYFRLFSSEKYREWPIEDRLKRVRAGEEDWELAALLFAYGKYLFLSSARENSILPAHLQGAWNDNIACRMIWTCDMHLDINTQMNYWMSESLGLGECNTALFSWIKNILMPSGEKTAKTMYRCKGWVAHIFSNAWGYSAPGWGDCYSVYVTGGAWVAYHLWEHYLYQGDKQFLEEYVYPVFKGLAEFFISYLTWDEKRNIYVTGPSISPENFYVINQKKYAFSMGPTADIVVVRAILEACVKMLKIGGKEENCASLLADILEKQKHLPPLAAGSDGRLLEWQEELEEKDRHHRHTSHLLSVYPFRQIHSESKKELKEAALASIYARWKPEEQWEDTGWARALLLLYSACLHQREDCAAHIRYTLAHGVSDNLLIMHPPTAGAETSIYELDGNTGYTAGIVEMLAHRIDDTIYVLPAIPKEWERGEAGGICLPGGICIYINWNKKEVSITLNAKVEQTVWVVYKDKRRQSMLGIEKINLIFN